MRRRAAILSALVTLFGCVGMALGALREPRQAAYALLAAYAFVASTLVGALFFVAIAHVSAAGWMTLLRRRAEEALGALPVLALWFVPIALSLRHLYLWAAPQETWSDAARTAILPKASYLNPTAFSGRAVFYLASWVALAELLRWASFTVEASRGVRGLRLARGLGAVTLPVTGFTLTFASFDWLMSLDPTWSSTTYGVYVFGGGFMCAVAGVVLAAFAPMPSRLAVATPEHAHAIGRVLFAFVIFWAYIAFAQYLLIWIADIPREVGWVQRRTGGGWAYVAVTLAVVHFALPFLLLLSRGLKRRPRLLCVVAAWLVVSHYLDVWWLVLPELRTSPRGHWLDLAALLAVAGSAFLLAILRLGQRAPVPLGDPELAEGLRYEAS